MSHLSDSDRLEIEHGLRRQMSFQQIARKLRKSHSTISREVKKRLVKSDKGALGRITNRCIFRRDCDVYFLCPGRKCQRKCSACKNCNAVCSKFQEEICRKLSEAKDSFTVCEKTVYRYINAGIIRTRRGDMPRSCSMKPRKQKNPEHKVDSKCRINRTHEDFKKYCEEYPDSPVVEMDSVLGGGGGKVLLIQSCIQ